MIMARMFLDQHAFLHSGDITDGPSFFDQAFADLTDAQMRVRPGKGMNSLAWLLWHMARTEDVNVNLVIVDRGQVFNEAWARRLNVSRADIGTGMTEDEVGDLTNSLGIAAARAYRNSVGRRTREVVASLGDSFLEEIVGPADVARARAAGAIGTRAEWLLDFMQNQPRATRLMTVGITHNARHIGEAQTLRSFAGFGGNR
jgi:hypothetical protein